MGAKKYSVFVVAPLVHMVWDVGNQFSFSSWHEADFRAGVRQVWEGCWDLGKGLASGLSF